MRQLELVWCDHLGLGQPVDVELPEVLADRRDELGVVEPDQVGAALDRGVGDLEAQRRDPVCLIERGQVVEQQVLTGIAEKPDPPRRIDARCVATGGAVEVGDLVRVVTRRGVVVEQAHASPPLETVQAVPVESNVESVWIGAHDHRPTVGLASLPVTPSGRRLRNGTRVWSLMSGDNGNCRKGRKPLGMLGSAGVQDSWDPGFPHTGGQPSSGPGRLCHKGTSVIKGLPSRRDFARVPATQLGRI